MMNNILLHVDYIILFLRTIKKDIFFMFIHYSPFRQALPLKLNVCSCFIGNQFLIFLFFFNQALFSVSLHV